MAEGENHSVDVAAVARQHRRLRELAEETTDEQLQAILILAAAVLLHGELEAVHLGAVRRFVDPAVLHELSAEHERLAEDVAYLQELHDGGGEPTEVPELAAAIRRRVLSHLKRDERILYRPMRRFQHLGDPESPS